MKFFGIEIRRNRPSNVRRYDAAHVSRLTADWVFGPLSCNEEIRGGIETVRSRARELERNDNLARKYLAMVEANIVGRGFQLRVVDGESVRDRFAEWSNSCDARGALSWADIQRLVVRTAARDGDLFVRFLRGSQYKGGFALQVLEGDYVDHMRNEALPSGNRVIMGIEVDQLGREVAAYFRDRHPGDGVYTTTTGRTERISAQDYIHIFRQERPGQVRAVSWMAASMQSMRMLHAYQEAELVAARIGSCKMGFYKIPPGESFGGDGKDGNGAPLTDATPGVFEQMPTGWDFTAFNPQHPTTQYGIFVKDIKRDIAGGLNVAYNNLANDLEGVSFSSIRSGTIEEREQWIVFQDWFARAFLRPVFAEWLRMAALGAVITPSEAEQFSGRDVWAGRRWPWVDPQSDIAAKKEEVALGLTTPSMIADERGTDFVAIQKQLANDNAVREGNNLSPIAQAAASAAVQDTALNGAQIASLVQIMQAAASGLIPAKSVGPILAASFPSLDNSEISSIVSPLNGFEPAQTSEN